MDIERILAEIIPPNNRDHREGFNNILLIEKLSADEKVQVENNLIQRLNDHKNNVDFLIVETLAYLKSEKALPILYDKLNLDYDNKFTYLIIAISIFEINIDSDMIDIAINTVKTMDIWGLISAFYYLAKFQNPVTNSLIKKYINDKDYLVSYNARRFYNPILS